MNWKNGEYHPRQKRADEKKGRILDAALALFADKGFHGTTAKAIAAKAGVATGSFYRYFRDKKAVFLGVCTRMEAEMGEQIFEFGHRMRQDGHAEPEVMTSLIHFVVEAHRHNKAFHREVLAMQFMDSDVAAWTRAREMRLLTALSGFLEARRASYRVRDLEAATELVYYVMEEISHRAVIVDSPVGEKRLVRELQEMLVRYLFE